MKVRLHFWGLLFLVFLFGAFSLKRGEAAVHQVDSFLELKNDLSSLSSSSLVVLDVDEVLVTDRDAILSPSGDALRVSIYNDYFNQASTETDKVKVAKTLNLPLFLTAKIPVEKSWSKAIEELQKRGIKVIALTSCPIEINEGAYNLESWRIEQLKKLGIELSKSFPGLKRQTLYALNSKSHQGPLYSEGILFTGPYSKADVLSAFLKQVHLQPSTVLFVDNLLCNVQRMEIKLIQEKIPHLGFHYRYVEKKKKLTVDPELAIKQFEHLFEYGQWLSDEEAREVYFSQP